MMVPLQRRRHRLRRSHEIEWRTKGDVFDADRTPDRGVVGFSYNDGTKEALLRLILKIMDVRGR